METDIFSKALVFILKYEGGYSNNPDDKGGMTYKGITQFTYNTYRIRKGLKPTPIATEYKRGTVPKGMQFVTYVLKKHGQIIKNVDVVIHLSIQEIKEIYYKQYWLAAKCDKMTKQLAVCCFDTAVNMGAGIVKSTGMTRCEEFLKAASYKYPNKFIDAREDKYRLFAQQPSQAQFLGGWLNRTKALRNFIETL